MYVLHGLLCLGYVHLFLTSIAGCASSVNNILCDEIGSMPVDPAFSTSSWTYTPTSNNSGCTLRSVGSGVRHSIWYGDVQGSTYNTFYSTKNFILETRLSLTSGSNAGLMFRATSLTDYFYVGISPSGNSITIWKCCFRTKYSTTLSFSVDYGTEYTLRVEAQADVYTISLNDVVIWDSFTVTDKFLDLTGTVGLVAFQSVTTFYSLNWTRTDNMLCHSSDINSDYSELSEPEWNFLDGTSVWTQTNDYDDSDCSLTSETSTTDSFVWFGDASGQFYSARYSREEFLVTTHVSIQSGDVNTSNISNAGLIFRADTVDGDKSGDFYYFAVHPDPPRTGLRLWQCCWNETSGFGNVSTEFDKIYKLSVEGQGTTYKFYLDDVQVFEKTLTQLGTTGSVGMLAWRSISTFYSFEFENLGPPSKAPTSVPTTPTLTPTIAPTVSPSVATIAPSASPVATPSASPTNGPSTSPSGSPTNSPSRSPSSSPFRAPTNTPTTSPTLSPTAAPVDAPTNWPTVPPSNSPTVLPTVLPTESPTVSPTTSPTSKPTDTPSQVTQAPSTQSTRIPSESTTQAVILSELSSESQATKDSTESVSLSAEVVLFFVFGTAFLFAIAAFCKRSKDHNISDIPNYAATIAFFQQSGDFWTDCLFSYILFLQGLYSLGAGSITFIVVPFVAQCGGAIYFTNKWLRSQDIQNERLVVFIKKYDKLIFALTVFSGFYAAVDLFTSKIFAHSLFYFPLTHEEKHDMKKYKFISIVVLEGIPQFVIQIIYLMQRDQELSNVVYISMIFSVLTLCFAFLDVTSDVCKLLRPREEKFTHVTSIKSYFTVRCNNLKSTCCFAHTNIANCMDGMLKLCDDSKLWKGRSDIDFSTEVYFVENFVRSMATMNVYFETKIMSVQMDAQSKSSQLVQTIGSNIKQMAVSGTPNYKLFIDALKRVLTVGDRDELSVEGMERFQSNTTATNTDEWNGHTRSWSDGSSDRGDASQASPVDILGNFARQQPAGATATTRTELSNLGRDVAAALAAHMIDSNAIATPPENASQTPGALGNDRDVNGRDGEDGVVNIEMTSADSPQDAEGQNSQYVTGLFNARQAKMAAQQSLDEHADVTELYEPVTETRTQVSPEGPEGAEEPDENNTTLK